MIGEVAIDYAEPILLKGWLLGLVPSGYAAHRTLLPGVRRQPMHGHARIMSLHATTEIPQAVAHMGASASSGDELVGVAT